MTGSMLVMENQRRALGESVEAARIRKGWSKEHAAQEAKISAITWKRIEDGLNVHDVKLASALRVLGLDNSGQSTTAPDGDQLARLEAEVARLAEEIKRLRGSSTGETSDTG